MDDLHDQASIHPIGYNRRNGKPIESFLSINNIISHTNPPPPHPPPPSIEPNDRYYINRLSVSGAGDGAWAIWVALGLLYANDFFQRGELKTIFPLETSGVQNNDF